MGLRSRRVLMMTASRTIALLTSSFWAGVSLRAKGESASAFFGLKAAAGRADATRTVRATAAVSLDGRFIGFGGSLASAATTLGDPFGILEKTAFGQVPMSRFNADTTLEYPEVLKPWYKIVSSAYRLVIN